MSETYSNKWGTDFASILKQFEQRDKIGAITGKIVKISPLTISIMSGDVILNSKVQHMFTTETLREKIDRRKQLMVGDTVLVIPNETEKVFYIIDVLFRE